ncbi:outer membrane lipoprotein-sorting protein [candidate division WOR-3 bacterium]|nr:outer membrane lipoprotein-sorting protein [candidate division WOR-3 bacterium]
MKRLLEIGIVLFLPLVLWAETPARQGLAGGDDEILKKAEDAMNAPKDRMAEIKLTLIDKDGDSKIREIKMWQLGKEKRLIKFLSPADVKGVGFLVLSDNEMYLYMPAFKKIRRIASHAKNENFMGTDFSYNDIGKCQYTKDFTAEIKEETEEEYILELTPRPKSDVDYAKLIVWVDKAHYIPNKVEYYNEKGKILKVMKNEDTEKVDKYWTPKKVTMENLKTEHKTVMEMGKVVHDIGFKEGMFTKRMLKRAE